MIAIDMDKARAVHRARLRVVRKPLLDELDLAWKRAVEAGDTQRAAAVVAEQQALRDLPASPAIDGAKTAEDLLAALPDAVRDRYIALARMR